jgi:acyl-CoA thioesterase YciA
MTGTQKINPWDEQPTGTAPDLTGFLPTHRKLIMNEDLNPANRLFGGRLMEWVDEAAALFCMTEIRTRSMATKKISEVIFNEPAHLGDVLEFLFRIKKAGRTSVTVEAQVIAKAISPTDRSRLIVRCDLVFVALDAEGIPMAHGYKQTSRD